MQKKFLVGSIFSTSWRFSWLFSKSTWWDDFSKMVPNITVLAGIFDAKFEGLIFFQKKFTWDSHIKFTPLLKKEKNLKDFFFKIEDIFFL